MKLTIRRYKIYLFISNFVCRILVCIIHLVDICALWRFTFEIYIIMHCIKAKGNILKKSGKQRRKARTSKRERETEERPSC